MRIELGQDVYSSDGKNVGSVDHLVLDDESKMIQKFVVGGGLFGGGDKLVDHSMVERTTADGVYLDQPSATFDQLPALVEETHVDRSRSGITHGTLMTPSGLGGGRPLYDTPTVGRGYGDTAPGSFFDPAPIDPPVVETDANIRDQDIIIDTGTDVIGSDGDKVGSVDEVLFDDRGALTGFIVKAGFVFKHDVRVPVEWIESTGGDHIRLNVTADQADRAEGRQKE